MHYFTRFKGRISSGISLVICLLFSNLLSAQMLSGTYTVGGSQPNYSTLDSAIIDLKAKGVSGSVTFSVRPGTYPVVQNLSSIAGLNGTNSLTIQSSTNKASDVRIEHNSTINYCLYVNVPNVNIDRVTFSSNNAKYCGLVRVNTNSNNLKFRGVVFDGTDVTDSKLSNRTKQYLVYTDSDINADTLTFDSCEFNGGSVGFWGSYNGLRGAINGYNSFKNCKFKNQSYQGVYSKTPRLGFVFTNNHISLNNHYVSAAYTALYFSYADYLLDISNNTIEIIQPEVSGTYYVLNNNNSNNVGAARDQAIVNNHITVMAKGTIFGIYHTNGGGHLYLHNTMMLKQIGTATNGVTGVYFGFGGSAHFQNNHFWIKGHPSNEYMFNGRQYNPSRWNITSSHNCFYQSGNRFMRHKNFTHPNLKSMQDSLQNDTNSFVSSVGVFRNGNLPLICDTGSLNKGKFHAKATKDLLGRSRSYQRPVVGAFEAVTRRAPMARAWVINPNVCKNDSVQARILVSNANTAIYSWKLGTSNNVYVVNKTDILKRRVVSAQDAPAVLTIDAGMCQANDTATFNVLDLAVVDSSVLPRSGCDGDSVLLKAYTKPGGRIYWYKTRNNTPIDSGNVFGFKLDKNQQGNSARYYYRVENVMCPSNYYSHSTRINTAPSAPQITGDSVYCKGDSINLLAQSTGADSTLWFLNAGLDSLHQKGDTLSPDTSKTTQRYYVISYDNGCKSLNSNSVLVQINPNPTVNLNAKDTTWCTGAVGEFKATADYGTITWYSDSILSNSLTAGTSYAPNDTLGNGVAYLIADNQGCMSDTFKVKYTIKQCENSLAELGENNSWKLYPNPAQGWLVVESAENQIEQVEIINTLGKVVLQTTERATQKLVLDVSALPKGSYVVKVMFNNRSSRVKQLIVH